MPFAFEWLYRKLGPGYFWAYCLFEVASAFVITLVTLAIFSLYIETTAAQFWRAFVVAEVAAGIGLVWAMHRAKGLAWPLVAWVRAGKPADGALDAWRRAASIPRDFVVCNGWQPFLIVGAPIALVV